MSGSHRAGNPRAPMVRGLAVLVVLALVALLVWAIWIRPQGTDRDTGSETGSETGAGTTPSQTPSPSGSPAGTPSGTPDQTPSPSSTRDARPALPKLRESSPRRLVIPGVLDLGFTSSVEDTDGRLVPTSRTRLSRWAARGLPASPGARTVVIVGAANLSGRGGLSALSQVRTGAKVELRTDAGVLTYTVRESRKLAVSGQVEHQLLADRPGRLVLIGALYDNAGSRPTEDLVVVAELTGVAPA